MKFMTLNTKLPLDSPLLYSKLRYKNILAEKTLKELHPKAIEFFNQKKLNPGKIREHAARLLTSGALAGSLLLTSPKMDSLKMPALSSVVCVRPEDLQKTVSAQLKAILPAKTETLSEEKERQISQLLFNAYGITAVAKLGDTRLNYVYGFMGAEQHLPRFPGDSVSFHDDYQKSGITPGLGAWGYFAPSKQALTPDLIDNEKYYVAVQTLYLSDWVARFKYLSDFYKYRKVVVVNPENGKTIVCDIADSGPAWWTGKHFGGSPEVMAYLGLNVGMQKGKVILYFLDDSENNVSLGPLEYKQSLNQQS